MIEMLTLKQFSFFYGVDNSLRFLFEIAIYFLLYMTHKYNKVVQDLREEEGSYLKHILKKRRI